MAVSMSREDITENNADELTGGIKLTDPATTPARYEKTYKYMIDDLRQLREGLRQQLSLLDFMIERLETERIKNDRID
jgi:hypothetical protein